MKFIENDFKLVIFPNFFGKIEFFGLCDFDVGGGWKNGIDCDSFKSRLPDGVFDHLGNYAGQQTAALFETRVGVDFD